MSKAEEFEAIVLRLYAEYEKYPGGSGCAEPTSEAESAFLEYGCENHALIARALRLEEAVEKALCPTGPSDSSRLHLLVDEFYKGRLEDETGGPIDRIIAALREDAK